MNQDLQDEYNAVRANGLGFYEQKRGLIAVSGKEAVQFLNGLITNDVGKLESFRWMSAAFPNAQGRLLAVVRVLRLDGKFLFETEKTTHEKVFQNLFRFTFAGDFNVADLTEEFSCFSVRGREISNVKYKIPIENEIIGAEFNNDENGYLVKAFRADGFDVFVPKNSMESFADELKNLGAIEIGEEAREILRIENGVPLYGVDVDETTIVPELGIENLISYNKGCYIGQEIIARIHFRGHVAKQLTGLILESEAQPGNELKSLDGKNAGKITSVTFSPKLDKFIALAFVRYDYLAEGTELKINETTATVKHLPFIK
jgi:folate-binding protein YgfZ